MTYRITILAFLTCCASFLSANEKLTFEKDIRPILKAHCFQCHGESGVKEAELDLRLRHWILAGGDSGPAIAPKDTDNSILLHRVESGEMPPEDKRLTQRDVETLRDWIEQGAETARPEPDSLDDGEYFTEEERDYWAFQPVRRPSPPRVDGQINNDIDSFVLKRLEDAALSFNPTADRATLIRRVTFDLWGLPPTPQMVDAFVGDDAPDSYSRLIDRLLADPRYGERWGRHWLDVAGYADSEGYTNDDAEREFAYFYRDYVIKSFNDNKPLDEFVREQLAGDEMSIDEPELSPKRIELLAATGFLRMAPDGTGTGSVDRTVAANETIADTINIVTTAMLGLTVGCARCHDHRYDPISQADYYRLRAVFEPAFDWKQWKTPSQRRVSLYTDEDRKARAAIEVEAKTAEEKRAARQQWHIDRTLQEELLVAPDEKREALQTAYKTEKSKRSPEQTALMEEFPNIGNISPGSLYLYAEQRARRAGDIEKAAASRENQFLQRVREQAMQAVPEDSKDAVSAVLNVAAADRNETQQALAKRFPAAFVTKETLAEFDADAAATLEQYRLAAEECRKQDAKTELANMQAEIGAIRANAPKENFIRALVEPAGSLPATHLFVRGDHNQPSQVLEPAELSVLRQNAESAFPRDDPQLPTSGRRLAFARHLTDGKHPLLARVLMNRIWLHHFGRGIVETPGDFGMLGARPSHPELLDWLADELVRSEWDLKAMHRLILQSRTYRQGSARTTELTELDPENRLYGRMPVRRLESEAVRDSVLAVSGVLAHEMYGPPVPVKEDAVGQIVLGKESLDGERKPTGQDSEFPGVARRSLYIQVRRTRPLATLEAFDVAANSPNCTQRSFSNVAMQPLLMMNSEFILQHSERLAQQLINFHPELRVQLSEAWKRCFATAADSQTMNELIAFVEQQSLTLRERDPELTPEAVQLAALASACQAMFSSNQFIYVD